MIEQNSRQLALYFHHVLIRTRHTFNSILLFIFEVAV